MNSKPEIVIIEDEKKINTFLTEGLIEDNFSVKSFELGKLGLNHILKNKCDLILLDWMLPDIEGIDICKQIRSNNNDTPIIFITAKDTVQETIEGLSAGANDYIKKPFHFEELLARIQVQLRISSDENTDLTLNDIKIDQKKHIVLKGNEEIHLTQKEYDLLSYLLKNKGQVCSREKILADVWDIHFEYNSGVIDVYVNAIRKKLDLKDNALKTVRGVGYIIDEK